MIAKILCYLLKHNFVTVPRDQWPTIWRCRRCGARWGYREMAETYDGKRSFRR
jgi:hypothetical protein